jgi:peptide/nickel transport system permease protein
MTVMALVLVAGLLVMGLLGAWLTPHDPMKLSVLDKLKPPSPTHPFGTDELGRDLLSRVIFGTRFSLLAAAVVVTIAITIGVPVGLAAGYFGGRVDGALMRLTDVFLAFPSLVLAMAVAAVFGAGLLNAVIAVGIVWWPTYARLMRAVTLSNRGLTYVDAARSLGASHTRILSRHLLPNSLSPLMVRASMDAGRAVLMTAGLSFIGLGAQPPLPEWGSMVARGRDYFLTSWWFSTFPGLAIYVTVLAFSLLGDGLRDIFDPRLRRR